ncbi:FxSxx-COOH system tetratricopeptide repeat protein [Streptomyces sp. NPDC088810]|uniref:FxSxx-COOH system tetratricopeptide repeat protein n=1 Tax=Streptomyces sp. NPDC088810 TaxID=3365904 RepID=UPI003823DB62
MTGYVAGDVTVKFRAAPRTRAPWPHQVGVIPREAAAFQERDEVEQLRAAVTGGGTAVLCQVLRGTGGVGKTQLAAHYARQAWHTGELDVLVWVNAGSRPAIISTYAQAAEELLAAEPGDPERSAQAFRRWLEPSPPGSGPVCRWLVVLDDVADPADLTGLWPAKNPHGRTVVTTRRRDVAVPGQRIDLGVFTPEEAAAYLSGFLAEHGRHDDPSGVQALAQDLGYLPLALSQAAAYIVDADVPIDCPGCTHTHCTSYRRRLTARTTKLGSVLPEASTLPDDQTTTLTTTWSLSIERADSLRPVGLARPALQLAAMLDGNGIPQDILAGLPARRYLAQYRTQATSDQGRSSDVSDQDVRDALRALHRLNLIDHSPDVPHQAIRVHQLIQRATRDTLTSQTFDETARVAADALAEAWPVTAHAKPLGQVLRANADALTHHAQDALCSADEAHAVLLQAGNSLGHAGQVTAAVTHFQNLTRTVLGPDHPDSLAARKNLAHWLGKGGDETGAAAVIEQLLPDMVRTWGPDDPDTLATRGDLASWRGIAGDAAGAVAAYEELMPDLVRLLGPDHPHTLAARGNLARNRGMAGDAVGAAADFAQLLADRTRVQGPDHRGTLATRRELARSLGQAEDAALAAEACEQLTHLLADCVRVLGADHPDTLATRRYLANSRGAAGDAAGAVAAYEELMPDLVRVLGTNHPDTLATRGDLAGWRGQAGDAAGAVAAYKELLPDVVQALGADHQGTLTARNGLAYLAGEAGDAAGAVAAYDKLLPDLVRVLGTDHPTTLIARGNLAHWRGRAGDAAGAAADFARLVADLVRVLGRRHPRTRAARDGVAHWRGQAKTEVSRLFRKGI